MTQKLNNAKNLYLEGIRDGDIDAIYRYTGSRYIQHSTGVKNGQKGFIEFFQEFLKRSTKRDIQIIRAIEDSNFVFLHVYQNINDGESSWITADMFDTDDNHKLIEHWDVISAYQTASNTASGNDPILGDFQISDLDKTEENKAIIRRFIVDILQNKQYQQLSQYISEDTYIQHNPNISDGLKGFEHFLNTQELHYNFVFHTMGQGNYVVTYSKATLNGMEFAVFDIFRLENGKIVEHWDNMEQIPMREDLVNWGKF